MLREEVVYLIRSAISNEYFSKDKRVVNLDETTNKIAEIFSDKSKTI